MKNLNYVNFDTKNKRLFAYHNYWGPSGKNTIYTGETTIQKKPNTVWTEEENFSGELKIFVSSNDKMHGFINAKHRGSSYWENLFYFNLNPNQDTTLQLYWPQFNFNSGFFTNDNSKILLSELNKIYTIELLNNYAMQVDSLIQYPNNTNFNIFNSIDDDFFFVVRGNSLNIHKIDNLSFNNSFVLDSAGQIKILKNSINKGYVFLNDNKGNLFRINFNIINVESKLISGSENNVKKDDIIFNLISVPNPTNEITDIKFDLKIDADLQLKIFNSLGTQIYVSEKGHFKSGSNIIAVNFRPYSIGYYYVIEANSIPFAGKIVYLK